MEKLSISSMMASRAAPVSQRSTRFPRPAPGSVKIAIVGMWGHAGHADFDVAGLEA